MKPIGAQGFETPEKAKEDAISSFRGIDFYILKRKNNDLVSEEGDFAWVAPISYAENLIKSGVAERIII